jgi:DNA-binding LytR/AlgR family response regulator
MNIIIIEDELRTARALASILLEIDPDIKILGILTTVREAIDYFNKDTEVDLIFMDILLSDGHCFDIFEEIDITHPIIFCTAYNDYMTEAFKVNGIDYILKPINKASLTQALGKWGKLKSHFVGETANRGSTDKKVIASRNNGMLVFDKNCYQMLPFKQIAYFYLVGGLPAIKTMDGQTIFSDQSLTALMSVIPNELFYKINRQYIIQKEVIFQIVPSYLRNLEVRLKVPVKERLMVNKNKKTEFLNWFKGLN